MDELEQGIDVVGGRLELLPDVPQLPLELPELRHSRARGTPRASPPPLPPPGSGRPRPAPPRRARSTACLLGFQRGGRSNAAHHPPAHARARQRPTPTTANQGDGKRGEEMDFSIAISASLSLSLSPTPTGPLFPSLPPCETRFRCGAVRRNPEVGGGDVWNRAGLFMGATRGGVGVGPRPPKNERERTRPGVRRVRAKMCAGLCVRGAPLLGVERTGVPRLV